MTFRIAQISDTHLSDDKPFFVDNFVRIGEALRADRPDLVLNSGDIALDGASRESDLAAARALHDGLDLPVRFLPGNHDIGDCQDAPAHGEGTIDAERRARYVAHFGTDWWTLDVPGWRLLGDQRAAAGQRPRRGPRPGRGDRRGGGRPRAIAGSRSSCTSRCSTAMPARPRSPAASSIPRRVTRCSPRWAASSPRWSPAATSISIAAPRSRARVTSGEPRRPSSCPTACSRATASRKWAMSSTASSPTARTTAGWCAWPACRPSTSPTFPGAYGPL